MFGFGGGLGELVGRLVERIPAPSRHLRSRVQNIRRGPEGWIVNQFAAPQLLLALEAPQAARLVRTFDPRLGGWIASIRCRDTAVLNQIWAADSLRCRWATGMLIPLREGGSASAVSFVSRKWPGRVDNDHHALRIHLGGAGREACLRLSDAALIDRVTEELRPLLSLRGQPKEQWLVRHEGRMPEYALGHADLIAGIESLAASWPGLQLTGNWLQGVGLADCVARANVLAESWQAEEALCLSR